MTQNLIINQKSKTDEGLVISGVASTNKRDRQHEIITITPNALKKAWPEFAEKGAPMKVDHALFARHDNFDVQFGEKFNPKEHYWINPKYQDRVVGKVINMEFENADEFNLDSEEPQETKITFVALITDPEAIEDIENGELDSVSLGWQSKDWFGRYGQTSERIDKEIEIDELTLTKTPANPDAVIEKFHKVTDSDLEKQFFPKGELVATKTMAGKVEEYFRDDWGEVYVKLSNHKSLVRVDKVEKSGTLNNEEKGCVMVLFEPSQFQKILNKIDKDDLYIDKEAPEECGLAKNPHVTVFYGLEPKVSYEEVKDELSMIADKFTVYDEKEDRDERSYLDKLMQSSIGQKEIGFFSNEDKPYDVLYISVRSDDLIETNKVLKRLPNETEFPEYKPHITLAYLKKGVVDRYKNLEIGELDLAPIDVVFSGATDGEKYITLTNSPKKNALLEQFKAMVEYNKRTKKKKVIKALFGNQKSQTFDDYPKSAKDAAKKVLRWREEHSDEVKGMTRKGWARARQLAEGRPVDRKDLGEIASFARHKQNAEIAEEFRGEPWKDNGYVAWLGWGGDSMISWAQRKLEQLEK